MTAALVLAPDQLFELAVKMPMRRRRIESRPLLGARKSASRDHPPNMRKDSFNLAWNRYECQLVGSPAGSHPLSDIGGHWAEVWIEDLFLEGLTTGYPSGTYRPDNRITPAETSGFLLRAIHGPAFAPHTAAGGSFTDVSGHWAEDWIEQLKAEGLTSGYPDGTYRPNQQVTQAEMAMLLVNAFGLMPP